MDKPEKKIADLDLHTFRVSIDGPAALSDYMAPVRADYRRDVRAFAQDAYDEHKDKPWRQRDEKMEEHAAQSVDGCTWVIYTMLAECVVMMSDRSDSYEAELGNKPSTVEVNAAWIMMEDVRDQLADLRGAESEPDDEDDGDTTGDDLASSSLVTP